MKMERLIQQAKKSNRYAIHDLLMEHRTLLMSVVHRFLWNPGEWEDVMQTICMKTAKAIGQFNGTCLFSTWVYRIAVNECMEANRRYRRTEAVTVSFPKGMDIFPSLNAPDGLRDTINNEIRNLIHKAASELPDGLREAYDLFYNRQCTGVEAAAILNISREAFFVRLSDARNRLKQKLQTSGVTI